ncbi:hypothetical protein B0O99DRAFT_742474 [Bisporella sp. PMI_857]|nr:hypothetical protein B0O99DRAFT_742474 [Bisporella sp. PMI_857]
MSFSTMRGQTSYQPAEISYGISRGRNAVSVFDARFASASDPTREQSAQANSGYSHEAPYYANHQHGREVPGYSQRRWEAERPYEQPWNGYSADRTSAARPSYSHSTQRPTTTYSTTYYNPRNGQIGGSRQVFGSR